jgi:hypothetical protein
MSEQSVTPEAPQPTETGSKDSALWRLQGIFFEPRKVFEAIKKRPGWIVPVIALAVIAILANTYVINAIGYENIVRQQMMASPQIQEMPKDQREELIDQQLNSSFFKNLAYFSPVFVIIILLLLSLIFLLGMMVVGGETSFNRIFSVTAHGFFAYSLITSILLLLIVFITTDKQDIDIQNAVQSNLGVLFDKSESPVLFTVASSIDIFSFYLMFLLVMGLSVTAERTSMGTTGTLVIVLWLVYVAGKTGIAAIFS